MKNKNEKLVSEEKKEFEVKLKSEMYNHDNEKMERRDEDHSDAMMWGFVLGFILFFILLVCIIFFTNR